MTSFLKQPAIVRRVEVSLLAGLPPFCAVIFR